MSNRKMEWCGKEGEGEQLRGIFVPLASPSHLLPFIDLGRIFAMYGVDVTILSTTAHAGMCEKSIERDRSLGHSIRIHAVKFPRIPKEMGSLHGLSNCEDPETLSLLECRPFGQAIHDIKPDFILTDMFYPWTADTAADLGIPRLVYVGGTYLAQCAMDSLQRFAPHHNLASDSHTFLLPGLPHDLHMTRDQLPTSYKEQNGFTNLFRRIKEAEQKSYGSLLKSFYELEGVYEKHYKKVTGIKTWSVGPVTSWVNQDAAEKAGRGYDQEEREGIGKHGWLTWLDSKKDESVVYLCFGSMGKFNTPQLVEIAHALEDSGHDFLWVVRNIDDESKDFLTEFEKRVQSSKKGSLIWGWAPQLFILDHPAIGAVVTHCGMNSIMEALDAGLPMVTWPLYAEQFFNEKLLVDVVQIGVPVGAKKWRNVGDFGDDIVKREDIGKAIALVMDGGKESVEIRKRVKALNYAAKKAIQVGGSSHNNLKDIIEDLKSFKLQKLSLNNKGC